MVPSKSSFALLTALQVQICPHMLSLINNTIKNIIYDTKYKIQYIYSVYDSLSAVNNLCDRLKADPLFRSGVPSDFDKGSNQVNLTRTGSFCNDIKFQLW